MATHSRTLAWKIPWKEEPGGLQSVGSQESDTTERLHSHLTVMQKEVGRGAKGEDTQTRPGTMKRRLVGEREREI